MPDASASTQLKHWPEPLPGTPKVKAFAARTGLVFVMVDEMPGIPRSATGTIYRLEEFRALIAELAAVADECEAQQHLPLHELPEEAEARRG